MSTAQLFPRMGLSRKSMSKVGNMLARSPFCPTPANQVKENIARIITQSSDSVERQQGPVAFAEGRQHFRRANPQLLEYTLLAKYILLWHKYFESESTS